MKLTPGLFVVGMISLFGAAKGYCQNDAPQIIPAVQHWHGGEGQCQLRSQSIVIAGSNAELTALAEMFQEDIKSVTGQTYRICHDTPAKEVVKPGCIRLELTKDSDREEGYKIEIGDDVSLTASAYKGLFYATRSVLQMMAQDNTALPKGTILDEPDYRVRSMMFDVGRKFVPYEQLKDWLRAMSYVKMNELHLHLNDTIAFAPGFRLEMKTLPGLANKDGYYTQEQMKQLQRFAAARGITIVPEIDAPAHAAAFTTYRPDLLHPKLSSSDLDISSPETIKFMEKVFDEICEVFESKDIHIGTDELRLAGIRDKAEKEQLGEHFRGYINHFNRYLAKKGKRTRIWSGYEHMPGKTQPDKDIIIDMWVTNDANSKIDQGYSFINSNHGWTYIVPCTSIYGINNARVYEKWSPNYFNDKPGGTIPKDTPNLLGGKFHIWNDNGYQFAGYSNNEIARTAMPSLLVFSEKLWGRKGSDSFEAFQQRATAVFPGDDGFEFCPGSKSGHDARNPMLGSFPGTTFLNRHVPADGNGVVWKLDKPVNFTPNNALKPDIENSPDHLAYPWTASFDITRFSDVKIGWYEEPHGHEILMDSKLCTLYLDYTYYDKLDKTTQLPTVRSQGVCLVRAARSAAPTPEQHLNRQVAYFDYEVPIGKQVNLTFVGHKGYTELYVDGELVKRVNQQCVCPLKSVGDAKWGKSFHGILHSAVIYNTVRAPAGNGHTENGVKKRQISDKNVQTLSGEN